MHLIASPASRLSVKEGVFEWSGSGQQTNNLQKAFATAAATNKASVAVFLGESSDCI